MGTFYHIGLDDTDSSDGMCTTFLAYNLVKSLREKEYTRFVDYPNLIRHNPNIPWKTRGNASLVLRVESDYEEKQLFSQCEKLLRKYAKSGRANSGLVLLRGRDVPEKVHDFSRRALYTVLSQKETQLLLQEFNMRWVGLRSQQGIVGALAGIGNTLEGDHTYELIAYRKNVSISRKIEKEKIIEMERKTAPGTFSSYDEKTGRVMIMPHGPDPVLCGIRGESPLRVKIAFKMLLPIENLLGWMIFRSNQGTGEHLREEIHLDNLKAYYSGKVRASVLSPPKVEMGGHVFFRARNEAGELLCAAYEPTKDFRKEVLRLIEGDDLELGGGVRKSTSRHEKVLNLEYFVPLQLATKTETRNPRCPNCSLRMTFLGTGQGFKCPKCGHMSPDTQKELVEQQRELLENEVILPPIGAHRHLTRPRQRYGIDNSKRHPSLIREWASF